MQDEFKNSHNSEQERIDVENELVGDVDFTPKDLIKTLKDLNRKTLSEVGGNLTKYIKQLTNYYNCTYSSHYTDNSRRLRTYTCTFGGRQRSNTSIKSTICCKSFVKFMISGDRISFVDGYHIHNHPVSEYFIRTYRTCLTDEVIQKIRHLQELGISAEQIRMITNENIPSSHYYNIRRDTINNLRIDEIFAMKQEISCWPDWKAFYDYEIINNTKKICSISLINNYVATKNYAFDIWILDDTACTNQFSMELECIITMDENGNSQLLGFTLISNKTVVAFQQFFSKIKEYCNKDVRLAVMDRCASQTRALLNVFPACLYIFCRIHIIRNFDALFKSESEISDIFYDCMYNNRENEYFNYVNDHKNEMSVKQTTFICTLNDILDHWLPSKINLYNHYGNITSNRVEGYFGTLKKQFSHTSQSLLNISKTIKRLSDISRMASIKNNYVKNKISSTLIDQSQVSKIGKYALDSIKHQFYKLENNLDISETCDLCNFLNDVEISKIPCSHLMLKRMNDNDIPLVKIEDVGKRWIRTNCFIGKEKSSERIVENKIPFSFHNVMARIEPYASICVKNEKVQMAFTKFFSELDEIKNFKSGEEPSIIAERGRKFTHPRNNVVSGAPKKKRTYSCSICKSKDHNKATHKN